MWACGTAPPELPGSDRIDAKTLNLADKSIRQEKYWAFTFVLVKIAWHSERFSRWHERCPCHHAKIFDRDSLANANKLLKDKIDEKCTSTGCFLAGRRAPELACDAVDAVINEVTAFSEEDFFWVLATVKEGDRSKILEDVHRAKAKMALGLNMKYSEWRYTGARALLFDSHSANHTHSPLHKCD